MTYINHSPNDDETIVRISEDDVENFRIYFDSIREIIKSGKLRDFLLEYYDLEKAYKMEVEGDQRYLPVFNRQAWNYIEDDVDSLLLNINEKQSLDRDIGYIKTVMKRQAAISAKSGSYPQEIDIQSILYNGDIYSLDGIEKNGFESRLSDYFSYLSVAHRMADETYSSIQNENGKTPLRDEKAPTLSSILGCEFTLPMGVCSPTLLSRNDGTYDLLYARRADDILHSPSVYGVVPSGSLESEFGFDTFEHSITHTVIREFSEEVLNSDAEILQNESDKVEYSDEVDMMYEALYEGRVDMCYTSAFIPMLSPRLTLGVLTVINDTELSSRILNDMESNWEADEVKSINLPTSELPELYKLNESAPDALAILTESLKVAENQYDIDIGFDIN